MINFNDVTKENRHEHNPHWQQIPDHPYRILLFGGYYYSDGSSDYYLI